MVRVLEDFKCQWLVNVVAIHVEGDEKLVERLPHVDSVQIESLWHVLFHVPVFHLHFKHVEQVDPYHHFFY